MRFAIVTPVLNGEKFLDQSILSVVSQTGPFTIRYHVQDGGSKDRTLEILAAWKSRLARDFPVFCEGIEFSFASAPDRGVYEAINRGFAPCAYADADAMAWINADDRFEPGAFATVNSMRPRSPARQRLSSGAPGPPCGSFFMPMIWPMPVVSSDRSLRRRRADQLRRRLRRKHPPAGRDNWPRRRIRRKTRLRYREARRHATQSDEISSRLAALGWRPKTSLEEGVNEVYRWFERTQTSEPATT